MNKKHRKGAGYTIVEVMIFLAVSAALLISTMAVMSGQQRKQEFYKSVREADSKIRDVINDFATGYFPGSSSFGCTADNSGGAPVPTSTSSQQGTRVGCSFIGKVIHYAPQGTNNEGFRVVTVIGRQFKNAPLSDVVENIVEAKPVPLEVAETIDSGTFGSGLKVQKVTYEVSGGGGIQQNVGAIGFFSSFAAIQGGETVSGKQTTQAIVIPSTSLNQTPTAVNTAISNIGNPSAPGYLPWSSFRTAYVSRPISICFEGGSNQHGIIKLGYNQAQVVTTLTIGTGSCP